MLLKKVSLIFQNAFKKENSFLVKLPMFQWFEVLFNIHFLEKLVCLINVARTFISSLTKLNVSGKRFTKTLLNSALYLRCTWSILFYIAIFCSSEASLSKRHIVM